MWLNFTWNFVIFMPRHHHHHHHPWSPLFVILAFPTLKYIHIHQRERQLKIIKR